MEEQLEQIKITSDTSQHLQHLSDSSVTNEEDRSPKLRGLGDI